MNLLISTSEAIVEVFSASVSPQAVNTTSSNGSYTSPYYTVSYFNSSGDVSLLWEIEDTGSSASIVGDVTGNRIRVNAFGSNDFVRISIKCTVTDSTGSVSSKTALIIRFGNGEIR